MSSQTTAAPPADTTSIVATTATPTRPFRYDRRDDSTRFGTYLHAPLTTTFTPPPECFNGIVTWSTFVGFVNYFDEINTSNTVGLSCFPPGPPQKVSLIYSPGICPSGFTEIPFTTVQSDALPLLSGEHVAFCCMSGYTLHGECSSSWTKTNELVQFVSVSGIITYTSGTRTYYSNSLFTSSTIFNGIASIEHIAVEIRWHDSDRFITPIMTTTTTPIPSGGSGSGRSGTSENDRGSGVDNSDTGLSTGAKAGIGVGVSIAAILLLILVAMLIRRKRRRRHQVSQVTAAANNDVGPKELGATPHERPPKSVLEATRPSTQAAELDMSATLGNRPTYARQVPNSVAQTAELESMSRVPGNQVGFNTAATAALNRSVYDASTAKKLDTAFSSPGSVEAQLSSAASLGDVYDILKIKEDSVRVILLQPGNFDDQIKISMALRPFRSEEYEALSYTWAGEAKEHTIVVHKFECKIQGNLHAALQFLRPRSGEPRMLWADALCVNQASDEEKNVQVPRMGQIYNFAKKVLVWLGPPNKQSQRAMAYFNAFFGSDPGTSKFEESYWENQSVWFDFGDSLLNRPWWGRAWVVQEFVMACDVEFVCGHDLMREDLFFMIPAVALHRSLNMFSRPPLNAVEARNRTAIHLMTAVRYGRRTRQVKNDLSRWIFTFYGWDCGQELDRVYAYMGMVESCSIIPQYELRHRWWEVYEEVAYQIVMDKLQFDFVFVGQGDSKFSQVPHGSAPASWVPDLSLPYETTPVLPRLGIFGEPVFRASGGSTFDGSRIDGKLLIRGTQVAKIREITNIHDDGSSEFFASKQLAYGPGALKRREAYPHKPAHTHEVAFARTLCWDLNYDRERCRPGDTFVERDERTPVPPDYKVDLPEPRRAVAFEAALHVAATTHRVMRRFALLNEDYFAMVPPNSKEGDWVAILSGASIPVVMRQQGSLYTFIGACYVHGIMDGELWDQRGAIDTFLLC